MPWAAIGAIGSTIIGGAMSRRSAKKNRESAVQDTLLQLPRLRKSAEDAGFNPLTALQATGGQGFNNIPGGHAPLASVSAIQGAIQSFGEWASGDTERARKRQQVQDELQEIRLEQAKAGGATPVVERTRATDRLPALVGLPVLGEQPRIQRGMDKVRPQTRPGLWSEGAMPVIGPDGGNMQIPKKIGRRMGLAPWDALIIGDYEEMYGDEMGQLVGMPKIPAAIQQIEGGVVKRRTVDERQRLLDKPFSLEPYVPDVRNPNEYERPPMLQKPKPGWMDDFFN